MGPSGSRVCSILGAGNQGGFPHWLRQGFSQMLHAAAKHAVCYRQPVCSHGLSGEGMSVGKGGGPTTEGLYRCSRFGVIPKSSQPGKWRLIIDLSHPEGGCVNEGIRANLCSLVYCSIDNAVDVILDLGQGSLLAKMDLKSAYRNVWSTRRTNTVLPFGLQSAPKIFTALADGLIWMMGHNGAIHYLDDYLFFGRAGALQVALRVCEEVGMPVAVHKTEGPSTALVFLGILIDTVKMEIRLPADKLARLQLLINQWSAKTVCTKRDLLSLLGHL